VVQVVIKSSRQQNNVTIRTMFSYTLYYTLITKVSMQSSR